MSKYYVANDLGLAFRWNEDSDQLECANIRSDYTFDFEDEDSCDVIYLGKDRNMDYLYRWVRPILKGPVNQCSWPTKETARATTTDLRLKMKVSDMILDLVRDAVNGDFDGVPNGDIQGTCEALAVNIISAVKESV
jgi:hypothetical protein